MKTPSTYTEGSRIVSQDLRVWERHQWGWKFLGISKSTHRFDVLGMPSTNVDNIEDIVDGEKNER